MYLTLTLKVKVMTAPCLLSNAKVADLTLRTNQSCMGPLERPLIGKEILLFGLLLSFDLFI